MPGCMCVNVRVRVSEREREGEGEGERERERERRRRSRKLKLPKFSSYLGFCFSKQAFMSWAIRSGGRFEKSPGDEFPNQRKSENFLPAGI